MCRVQGYDRNTPMRNLWGLVNNGSFWSGALKKKAYLLYIDGEWSVFEFRYERSGYAWDRGVRQNEQPGSFKEYEQDQYVTIPLASDFQGVDF